MEWDIFISHVWEDKDSVARPLAEALQAKGLRVWFDEISLTVGDSLRRSIDYGLANSEYGIIILSPNFFAKEWPQKELDGLVSKEVSGVKVILPIWHNITADKIREYSPTLADRVAVTSKIGLENVVTELLRAIEKPTSEGLIPEATDAPSLLKGLSFKKFVQSPINRTWFLPAIITIIGFLVGVLGNLIAGWIQQDLLGNVFTLSGIIVILVLTIFGLIAGIWLQTQPQISLRQVISTITIAVSVVIISLFLSLYQKDSPIVDYNYLTVSKRLEILPSNPQVGQPVTAKFYMACFLTKRTFG